MLRNNMGMIFVMLFIFWVINSVAIGVLVPKLRGKHIRIIGYGLLCVAVSFVILFAVANGIVIFFN